MKAFDDQAMTKLLALYSRPEPPTGLWDRLYRQQPPRKRGGRLSWILGAGGGVLAAAAVLAVVFGLPRAAESGLGPGALTQSYQTSDQSKTLTWPGERLVLAPRTDLVVETSASVGSGRVYRLAKGSLYLDHTGPGADFTVATRFGTFSPVGTRLTVEAKAGLVVAACWEGEISFRPVQGSSLPESRIPAGQLLRLTEGGRAEMIPLADLSDSESLPWRPDSEAEVDREANAAEKASQQEPPASSPSADSAAPSAATAPRSDSQTSSSSQNVRPSSVSTGPAVLAEIVLASESGRQKLVEKTTGRVVASLDREAQSAVFEARRVYLYQDGKLTAWDEGFRPLWEASVGPLAFTDFAVQDGRVLLGSADGNLYVLDAVSGESRLKVPLGAGSYGTPLLWKNRIFLSTLDKRFVAVDALTGSLLWSRDLPERLVGDRPRIEGDFVVTQSKEGREFRFDPITGVEP